MSLRRPAKEQPETFEFNSSSLEAANAIVSKYPKQVHTSSIQGSNNSWKIGFHRLMIEIKIIHPCLLKSSGNN